MPGLNQLKQFSEDVKNLGKEIEVRAKRGERPVVVPLPQGISEADDSQDFVLGMPVKNADAASPASLGADSSEDAIPSFDELMEAAPVSNDVPDFDSILSSSASSVDDLPDLSDFEDDLELPSDTSAEPPAEAPVDEANSLPPPAEAPADEANSLPPLADTMAAEPESASETTIENDQDALSMLHDIDNIPDVPSDATDYADMAGLSGLPSFEDMSDAANDGEIDLSDIKALSAAAEDLVSGTVPPETAEPEAVAAAPADAAFADAAPADAVSEIDALPDFPAEDAPAIESEPEALSGQDSFENMLPPTEDALPEAESGDEFSYSGDAIELGAEEPAALSDDGGMEDLSGLPSFDDAEPLAAEPEEASAASGNDPLAALNDMPSLSGLDADAGSADSLPSFDDNNSFGLDPASFDADMLSGDLPSAEEYVPGFDGDDAATIETAPSDTSDPLADIASSFPVTGENPADFELDSNFEISGYTDSDGPVAEKKKGSKGLAAADKDKPRDSLTEEEYELFKQNLATYPLNVRIIVEDFISKNEFTDDAVFEVIEKILKKVPARQLAGHLEKMLDITIDVPRNYEHRSAAEYEAYKQSFQYQLKNRILPGAIAAILLLIAGYGVVRATHQFVYKPLKASSLYKQGYTLLENNEYPLSEQKFTKAVSYRPVKKWFFKYARGYREHKQYERAAQMYRNILGIFNHNKQAGLEYATMELYDRANYPRAEEIVRREVLDYHINDTSGLLLLGDIFLEWAEIDPDKYESAREQYSSLIQLYGQTDLYMSRMMRYFIRTDKLRNVLELKNRFYAGSKKTSLGAEDWTELSGYMLDKLYGKLDLSDEYLRSSIEDVLGMLELAVKLDASNPVCHYNLARYYLKNDNYPVAEHQLKTTLDLFEKSDVRNRRNIFREINAARILGELYVKDKEFLQAQEAYTRGINVYNAERVRSGIEGDENTGLLFADMGDIDYFVSGDMDGALRNYKTAISLKNDTPSLNYRVGAINYNKKNYTDALASFIKTAESDPTDPNLLLALANTLSLRGDNYAAQGYYANLITRLNAERARYGVLMPQQSSDDNKLVDLYLKANNNLGVTLYRLARQTGNSSMNAEAIVRLSDSMRAWDALTRNPQTMLRLPGSNLAAQNSKYITHAIPDYEPAIYTDIARILSCDKDFE